MQHLKYINNIEILLKHENRRDVYVARDPSKNIIYYSISLAEVEDYCRKNKVYTKEYRDTILRKSIVKSCYNAIQSLVSDGLVNDLNATHYIKVGHTKNHNIALVFAWQDGFDEIHNSVYTLGEYRICGKVGYLPINSLRSEYNDWESPIINEEPYDTEISFERADKVKNNLNWLYDEAQKIIVLQKGKF